MSPGRRVSPSPSITSAPSGMVAPGPAAVILPSWMTTLPRGMVAEPSKMRTFPNATALNIACEAPADGRDIEAGTAARPVARQNTTAACQCFLVSGIPMSITLLPAPEEPNVFDSDKTNREKTIVAGQVQI